MTTSSRAAAEAIIKDNPVPLVVSEVIAEHYPEFPKALVSAIASALDAATAEVRADNAVLAGALHNLPTKSGVPTQEFYLNYDASGMPECVMHEGTRVCAVSLNLSDTPEGLAWLQSACTCLSLFVNARRLASDILSRAGTTADPHGTDATAGGGQ